MEQYIVLEKTCAIAKKGYCLKFYVGVSLFIQIVKVIPLLIEHKGKSENM